MKHDDPRLRWIQQYVDGVISAEDRTRLERALEDDVRFRGLFLEYLNVDLGLSLHAASAVADEELPTPVPISHPPVWRRPLLAAAACAVCLLGAVWWSTSSRSDAKVVGSVGHDRFVPGDPVGNTVRTLTSGILELETARGVRIVIEAPATFKFDSPQQLHLMRGRLSADVPEQATGFTVITPSGKAVDLGTTFGVDVPLEGEAEVHVFAGKVIAESTDGKRQNLSGGEGYLLQADSGTNRAFRSAAFILPNEVAPLHAAFSGGQQARSKAMVRALQEDPSLIALIDFEDPANTPKGVYRMVQGRWPGSRAPEFVQVRDHISFNVGGDRTWPRLTLAAWVRLDRLGAPYQSLLHTDGWSRNNTGQVHWMVTQLNTMRLALFGNTLAPGSDERHHYPDSRTSVLPEQGRWVHLATVYDAEAKTVRFFLNGRFDKETRQEAAHPARLGPAQIGNWDRHDRKLSGRIDELLLLGRAMSDNEVQTLFEAGNPYR
ncbi:MAG: LamG-like jellyroll fold domain-containing protein [Verrucomicrobiota bacterium]